MLEGRKEEERKKGEMSRPISEIDAEIKKLTSELQKLEEEKCNHPDRFFYLVGEIAQRFPEAAEFLRDVKNITWTNEGDEDASDISVISYEVNDCKVVLKVNYSECIECEFISVQLFEKDEEKEKFLDVSQECWPSGHNWRKIKEKFEERNIPVQCYFAYLLYFENLCEGKNED